MSQSEHPSKKKDAEDAGDSETDEQSTAESSSLVMAESLSELSRQAIMSSQARLCS
jgi:hypothetical protein